MRVPTSEALTPVSTKQPATCPHRCRKNADRKARDEGRRALGKGRPAQGLGPEARRPFSCSVGKGVGCSQHPDSPPEPDGPAPLWVSVK